MKKVYKGITGRLWERKKEEERIAAFLANQLDIPIVVAQLLATRGIKEIQEAQRFLSPSLKESMPDPFTLKDMDKAVDVIYDFICKGKRIAIFGDYDVDGATSTALLKRFFQSIGIEITVYIPDRIEEGYGPNLEAFKKLVSQGHELIITVDCGTTAFEVFESATNMNVTCIVVDHHKAEAKLPKVKALVNPCRLDYPTPKLQNLAAVGLSFMLVVALNKKLRNEDFYKDNVEPDLRLLLDIVAVGTVADVVKLSGLNRTFVSQGLKVLRKRLNPGLSALCDVANLSQPPDAYHLGFVLGPRINAGGRVGKARCGSQLLSTKSSEEASKIAHELNEYNKERQEVEATVLNEAIEQVEKNNLSDNNCIIVGDVGWHCGVIGIVASRLKEKYQRPVAVISYDDENQGKASGRSVEGVDFGSLVHRARHEGLLTQGGGHPMAVGFSLDKDKQKALLDFFNEHMKTALQEAKVTHKYDIEFSIEGATIDIMDQIEKLGPFGMGNPIPRFRFRKARVAFVDVIGAHHVKCRFIKGPKEYIDAIAFRSIESPLGKKLLESRNKEVDIVGTLRKDTWMGREKITIFLEDLIPSEKEEG